MRADADRCGDPSGSFTRAVAEWTESSALDAADAKQRGDGTWSFGWCDSPAGVKSALKIAQAYLGESETDGPS